MRAPQQNSNLPPRAGSEDTQQLQPDGSAAPVTALNSTPVSSAPKVAAEDLASRDNKVRGSAVDPEALEAAGPAETIRFIVLRDCKFTDRGHRVSVIRGKIIDSLNYNINHLRRQGVRMKQLEQGDDGTQYLDPEFG